MAFAENTGIAADLTTDAAFRAWVAAVRQVLLDAGLTRTADSGQIDTATVTSPALATYAGYDIFQFTDSEQATDPVVFKLEYGKGSTSHTRHALRVTLGTGSDGSGGITNAMGTPNAGTHVATGTGNGYLSASFFDGALMLIDTNHTGTSSQQNFTGHIIERCRDVDGNYMAGALAAVYFVNGPNGYVRYKGVWVSCNPLAANPAGTAGGVALFGAIRICSPAAVPVQLNAMLLCLSDVSQGDSGSVSLRGTSMTYKRPAHACQATNDSKAGFPLTRTA